ncbi:alpha/beta hydrolase [Haloechinothrix sp. LS1_15]|uniref:alpha/beta hydrolase n=1 Tax=Haloechinothrix sp. LS1_15 TaxID=2652248 RepID=UPI002943FBE2|nr:alpha/beta hydrolase [Haloechinothrix sp. LS1_15]MDV6014742.1 alpha/beta hydrolase [Haloechinothrix sp. LS1_15]
MNQVSRVSSAILLAGVLIAACSPDDPDDGDGLPVTEAHGPVGEVPEGLEDFYGQRITWEDCASYATSETAEMLFEQPRAQCARIDVPLDYENPGGETITVGVSRMPASDPDERIGSLVTNPGGPGVTGMDAAVQTARNLAGTEVGERFDVVGFDPRGVGASEPAIECLTDEERDELRAEDHEFDGSPEAVEQAEDNAREFVDNCVERTEHGEEMLAHVGTREVVRDIDVLRSVLGDERLTYLGYSYGTRIGYSYAETFPGNVRALLLDGALDPEQELVDSLVAQGEGFGQAFDEFTEWCAARQDCPLGDDPDEATARYQDLVQPLMDRPVSLEDGRVLSFGDATIATVQALYSPDLWEMLKSGLGQLERQRGEQLMMLADMYNERQSDGSYTSTQDAFVAIRCMDDPAVTDRDEIADAQERYAEVAPFLDSGQPPAAARDECAFWPVPATSEPGLPDVDDVPPSLVISTTQDPATPYDAGVRLAEAMDGALLTFEGTQHTVFAQGNDCVDEAGVAYLVDLELPEEGATCEAADTE